jgi:DtxR family Mn-dependent transcriptional regulator
VGVDRSAERARQDYVKAIYQLGGSQPVKAAAVARYLGVSRASMSMSKRLLEQRGLIGASRGRTDALRLTARGRALAVSMLRRHRLVETFLYRSLRLPLERLHAEAESIEHAISEDIARRLARFLSYPAVDPHGHRIPYRAAKAAEAPEVPLCDVKAGSVVQVTSIPDRDPGVVRALSARRILPHVRALVLASGAKKIRLNVKGRLFDLKRSAGARVRVRLVAQ